MEILPALREETMKMDVNKLLRWDRLRFKANNEDYRPVIWPPLGPYWCSGQGDDYYIIVAYFPHGSANRVVKMYWPEARDIDRMQTDVELEYSDRFQEPQWWKEMNAKLARKIQ